MATEPRECRRTRFDGAEQAAEARAARTPPTGSSSSTAARWRPALPDNAGPPDTRRPPGGEDGGSRAPTRVEAPRVALATAQRGRQRGSTGPSKRRKPVPLARPLQVPHRAQRRETAAAQRGAMACGPLRPRPNAEVSRVCGFAFRLEPALRPGDGGGASRRNEGGIRSNKFRSPGSAGAHQARSVDELRPEQHRPERDEHPS